MESEIKEQPAQTPGPQEPAAGDNMQAQAVVQQQQLKLPSPIEALKLIQEIEEMRGSRVLTFFAYPDVLVRGDIPLQLYLQLRKIGRVKRIDLFLHSTGGESEVPWRIITLIRNFCKEFRVLIPFMAYSAATHVAMGADEIVMGDMSELSPVDPKRTHSLLPKEDGKPIPISVQDLKHCIEFLKREGGEYTPESLATIYSALFDKVHPLALGAIEQSYALARLLSEKALSTHMTTKTGKKKIKRIVDTFSDRFFSHQYRIGWKEAKELGLPVSYANGELWETMWKLHEHYAAFGAIMRHLGDNPPRGARPIVWVDSTSHRRILEEQYVLSADKDRPGIVKQEVIGAQWHEREWAKSEGDKDESTKQNAEI